MKTKFLTAAICIIALFSVDLTYIRFHRMRSVPTIRLILSIRTERIRIITMWQQAKKFG